MITCSALMFIGQGEVPDKQSTIVLKDVRGEYKNLDEIKPVLVNGSSDPIYLLPDHCGEAQLWLFYMNRYWRKGISKDCSESDNSIEVKPGESYQVPALVWRPLITKNGELIERKDFPGKYKIEITYSLRPLIKNGKPRLRYEKDMFRLSEEFIVVR